MRNYLSLQRPTSWLTFDDTLSVIGPGTILVARDKVIASHVEACIAANIDFAFVGGFLVMEHSIAIIQLKISSTICNTISIGYTDIVG